MDRTKVVYVVNGVIQGFWRRLAANKTFWIVAAFVLAAAQQWNQGEISAGEFYRIAQVGVIGILLRAALKKAELAANASNPEVENIWTEEKPKGLGGVGPLQGLFMAVCMVFCLSFVTGCNDKTKRFTDGNGNAIMPQVPPKVCFETGSGLWCYEKKPEPPPPPPPGTVLPAAKSYTLEK